jgi:hypothetical protein
MNSSNCLKPKIGKYTCLWLSWFLCVCFLVRDLWRLDCNDYDINMLFLSIEFEPRRESAGACSIDSWDNPSLMRNIQATILSEQFFIPFFLFKCVKVSCIRIMYIFVHCNDYDIQLVVLVHRVWAAACKRWSLPDRRMGQSYIFDEEYYKRPYSLSSVVFLVDVKYLPVSFPGRSCLSVFLDEYNNENSRCVIECQLISLVWHCFVTNKLPRQEGSCKLFLLGAKVWTLSIFKSRQKLLRTLRRLEELVWQLASRQQRKQ